jgi:colicin import membrane protein
MTFIRAGKRKHDGGAGLNNMIVLSFLLHALVLSIILFSPNWPSPKWTFGPVYTVDLVSIPLNSIEARYEKAISREVVGINSRNHSAVITKNTERISPISIKKIQTRKKDVSGKVGEAIKGIEKKVLSSSGEASSVAASRGQAEVNMKMRVYYSVIWSKIKQQWALPEGMLPDDNSLAIIEARILRNGNVADMSFEKKSGNKYFDESALKAIRKASPFPSLPEWIDGSYIEIGVRFHSSELR